jgi:hypothetical protein
MFRRSLLPSISGSWNPLHYRSNNLVVLLRKMEQDTKFSRILLMEIHPGLWWLSFSPSTCKINSDNLYQETSFRMRNYDVILLFVSSIQHTRLSKAYTYIRRFWVLEKRPVIVSGGWLTAFSEITLTYVTLLRQTHGYHLQIGHRRLLPSINNWTSTFVTGVFDLI